MADYPDIYSDRFFITDDALSVTVSLARLMPKGNGKPLEAETVALLRFAPENFKLLLMTARKQIKAREGSNGQAYKIPQEILTALNLTEADW